MQALPPSPEGIGHAPRSPGSALGGLESSTEQPAGAGAGHAPQDKAPPPEGLIPPLEVQGPPPGSSFFALLVEGQD